MNLITYLRMLLRNDNDSGQDLIEYALLVALISLVCVAILATTGTGVQNIFQAISDKLNSAPVAP